MGASREKKARKITPKQDVKKSIKKKEDASSPVTKVMAGFVIMLIVLGAAALFLNATHLSQRIFPAATVGEVNVSAAEYNIYYANIYNSVYENYKNDDTDPMEESFYPLFLAQVEQETDRTIQRTVTLAAEARANGVTTLSEDRKSYFDTLMDSIIAGAREENIGVNRYLASRYFAGVTRAIYEKYLTDGLLADQWLTEKTKLFTYSQAEYEAYYDEKRDELDTVNFRYFSVPVVDDHDHDDEGHDHDADVAAAQEEARAKADAFYQKAVSETAFAAAAVEYADENNKETYEKDPDASLFRYYELANLIVSEDQEDTMRDMREWLTDRARSAGDRTVLPSSDGQAYQIFYFVSRQRADYHPVNVRHILFTFKDEEGLETSTPSDGQKEAAGKLAQEAYGRWEAGAATEDSFAELATEVSEDPGSKDNGGLYENVSLGQMVAPFEEWCFDASRKTGDTGIVETSYGFHIMYYISAEDNLAWVETVRGMKANEDTEGYLNSLDEAFPYSKKEFGMSLTRKRV